METYSKWRPQELFYSKAGNKTEKLVLEDRRNSENL